MRYYKPGLPITSAEASSKLSGPEVKSKSRMKSSGIQNISNIITEEENVI